MIVVHFHFVNRLFGAKKNKAPKKENGPPIQGAIPLPESAGDIVHHRWCGGLGMLLGILGAVQKRPPHGADYV